MDHGSTVAAPANPTKLGYTFGGWYGSSELTASWSFNSAVTQNITLHAKWTPYAYFVAYHKVAPDANGSTVTSTHAYGEAKILTENGFTRTGYSFAGWDTAAAGEAVVYANTASVINLTAVDNATVTLYAKWTPYS